MGPVHLRPVPDGLAGRRVEPRELELHRHAILVDHGVRVRGADLLGVRGGDGLHQVVAGGLTLEAALDVVDLALCTVGVRGGAGVVETVEGLEHGLGTVVAGLHIHQRGREAEVLEGGDGLPVEGLGRVRVLPVLDADLLRRAVGHVDPVAGVVHVSVRGAEGLHGSDQRGGPRGAGLAAREVDHGGTGSVRRERVPERSDAVGVDGHGGDVVDLRSLRVEGVRVGQLLLGAVEVVLHPLVAVGRAGVASVDLGVQEQEVLRLRHELERLVAAVGDVLPDLGGDPRLVRVGVTLEGVGRLVVVEDPEHQVSTVGGVAVDDDEVAHVPAQLVPEVLQRAVGGKGQLAAGVHLVGRVTLVGHGDHSGALLNGALHGTQHVLQNLGLLREALRRSLSAHTAREGVDREGGAEHLAPSRIHHDVRPLQ